MTGSQVRVLFAAPVLAIRGRVQGTPQCILGSHDPKLRSNVGYLELQKSADEAASLRPAQGQIHTFEFRRAYFPEGG